MSNQCDSRAAGPANPIGNKKARSDTKRLISRLLVATLGWLSLIGLNTSLATPQDNHRDNGVWLGYAYVTAQSYIDNVATLAQDMKDNYSVLYWFVNVGKVNSSGQLIGGAAGLSKAAAFLNALSDWEASHGYKFDVLAWINGTLTTTDADYIDVNNAIKRQAIVMSAKGSFRQGLPAAMSRVPGEALTGFRLTSNPVAKIRRASIT
jgi:hypothetical protein